jgi:hypothetical protein
MLKTYTDRNLAQLAFKEVQACGNPAINEPGWAMRLQAGIN